MLWGCSQWGDEHSSPLLACSLPSNCRHHTWLTHCTTCFKERKEVRKVTAMLTKQWEKGTPENHFYAIEAKCPCIWEKGSLSSLLTRNNAREMWLLVEFVLVTLPLFRGGGWKQTAYNLTPKRNLLSVRITFLARPLKLFYYQIWPAPNKGIENKTTSQPPSTK